MAKGVKKHWRRNISCGINDFNVKLDSVYGVLFAYYKCLVNFLRDNGQLTHRSTIRIGRRDSQSRVPEESLNDQYGQLIMIIEH